MLMEYWKSMEEKQEGPELEIKFPDNWNPKSVNSEEK
jgi:hypothetical protein